MNWRSYFLGSVLITSITIGLFYSMTYSEAMQQTTFFYPDR